MRMPLTLLWHSLRAFAIPKAPGRASHLNLSTGRSRSSETFSERSSQTDTGSLIPPILRYPRNRASRNLRLRWRFCLPAVTERNERKYMAVRLIDSRHPSYLRLLPTWLECVRHYPSESRFLPRRNESSICRPTASTRYFPQKPTVSTALTSTALCSMSCIPSRTESYLMS